MEKVKVSHNETDAHTGWNGGMGDLRQVKWISDERFVSGRVECVCVKLWFK